MYSTSLFIGGLGLKPQWNTTIPPLERQIKRQYQMLVTLEQVELLWTVYY